MSALERLLDPACTRCELPGGGQKAIFEEVAGMVAAAHPGLDPGDVIGKLLAREKLGSTGLGGGIAIPHCRIPACEEPVGALVTLLRPADFDAPDDQPVDLLFVLLVPEEAHQEHLDMLASIARLFSQESLCQALRACQTDRDLYATALDWQG